MEVNNEKKKERYGKRQKGSEESGLTRKIFAAAAGSQRLAVDREKRREGEKAGEENRE